MASPAAKRRRIESPSRQLAADPTGAAGHESSRSIETLNRDISPPSRITRTSAAIEDRDGVQGELGTSSTATTVNGKHHGSVTPTSKEQELLRKVVRSPFQLNRIRDLPVSHNVDTVTLPDLIGDPLIRELWLFNYLFDIDFIIRHLDADVKALILVKIVHGFWKRDDVRRSGLELSAKKYANVELICAHMPEPFGTHHSKMMVVFKHDDTAEVVIHTANMISQDWANLTQGVWRSSALPLLNPAPLDTSDLSNGPIGSGERFQSDLICYLKKYEGRTKGLVKEVCRYDFRSVRAAFIASAPSRQEIQSLDPSRQTSFGWLGLKEILLHIRCPSSSSERPGVTIQISSVATLSERWLNSFLDVLGTQNGSSDAPLQRRPRHQIIFPTADEVRRSLDGYESGASIHMRIQSTAQQKQLALLRPMLCHWASDANTGSGPLVQSSPLDSSSKPASATEASKREALRNRAAPHIKTYIRFADNERRSEIDWAMLTSANLSQQAWGTAPGQQTGRTGVGGRTGRSNSSNSSNAVRISSYEVGVVIWPALFADDTTEKVRMVPVFGKDEPQADIEENAEADDGRQVLVGLRMPYDLPLLPYERQELPWCATATHREPDWKGMVWEVGDGNGRG